MSRVDSIGNPMLSSRNGILALILLIVFLQFHTAPTHASPPEVLNLRAETVSSPHLMVLMNWDEIKISCNFAQDSEIRSVILCYNYSVLDLSSLKVGGQWYQHFMNMSRTPQSSNEWYYAIVPPFNRFYPQSKEGFLYVYINATNTNGEYLKWKDYPVSRYFIINKPDESRFRIAGISLGSINYSDLTIPIKVTTEVYLPLERSDLSMYNDTILVAQDRSGAMFSQTLKPTGDFRFDYWGDLDWPKTPIYGNPKIAPLDTYEIDLTFSVWTGHTNFTRTEVSPYVFFSNQNDAFIWRYQLTNVTRQDGGTKINIRIFLERSSTVVIEPITASFFVLGFTLALDVRRYFRHRLTIYMGLFVFSVPVTQYITRALRPSLGRHFLMRCLSSCWYRTRQ